ncbi:MAG: TonB-dependent receptor [Bermanella sp.]
MSSVTVKPACSPSALFIRALLISPLFISALASAADDPVALQQVYITGGQDEISTLPGSATLIDQVSLEQFEYTDIHRILNEVPGINILEEDGYGLRPNIGMRGSSAERSKKITIMEDGVLSGPAPYSAPAAYYFPNVSRMSAVEVFKGPAAIQYGPATVAGALNLVSRAIPYAPQGEVDAQLGSFEYRRLNAYYGEQIGNFGYLIEALNVTTTGFKDLDNGGDTGFERNDLTLKTSYDLNGQYRQRVTLKLGYADENSDETYVGLSEADFAADPYRRYAASSLDNMQWQHSQIQLNHVFEPTLTSMVTTDVYRNEFSRDWFKLNGFAGGASIDAVLRDPSSTKNSDLYKVLSGELASSAASGADQLYIGNNGRDFVSQGIQSRLNLTTFAFGLSHEIEVGVRLHMDEIKRHHTQQKYDMTASGLKVAADSSLEVAKQNRGEATALAVYVKDDMQIDNSTLSLGLRAETIDTELTDFDPEAKTPFIESTETVLVPGVGIFTQLSDHFGVLAGVHKGYVASAPGQVGEIDPEESINYELGFRLSGDHSIEVIAFANDYSNLKGNCSASNSCNNAALDMEINGGEVLVYGLESNWKTDYRFQHYTLPLNVTYTYTQTEFENSFADDAGIFTDAGKSVTEGDELPYVPAQRLNVKAGVHSERWQLNLSALYQGKMRDKAGQGTIAKADKIDAYLVLDLAANYQIRPELAIYGTVDNLLAKEYKVAAQPMGYRPGKPRTVQLGVKYSF